MLMQQIMHVHHQVQPGGKKQALHLDYYVQARSGLCCSVFTHNLCNYRSERRVLNEIFQWTLKRVHRFESRHRLTWTPGEFLSTRDLADDLL